MPTRYVYRCRSLGRRAEDNSRRQGHLLVCKGCCCGNTRRNIPPVPLDRFKKEWKERDVTGTPVVSGCAWAMRRSKRGPAAFPGSTLWFHSINTKKRMCSTYTSTSISC